MADILPVKIVDLGSGQGSLKEFESGDTVPVAQGGTGASTPPNARTALGLGTAATANVQTSASDSTAGRVLINGGWGIGGNTVPIGEADLDTARPNGRYNVIAAAAGKLPINTNGYINHWSNPSTGYAYQTYQSVLGTQEYKRYQVAGAWGNWGLTGVSQGYIEGLVVTWNSATSITVSTGAAYIPGTGMAVNVTSALTLSGLSLTANTWYYLYLYVSAGVPAIELVTTATAVYFGTARNKSGDTSRRFLCALRSNTGTGLFSFQVDSVGFINYTAGLNASPFRVLTLGAATTATAVNMATVVPPTTRTAMLLISNSNSTAVMYIHHPDFPSNLIRYVAPSNRMSVTVPLNTSQQISYSFSATGGDGTIDVVAYGGDR